LLHNYALPFLTSQIMSYMEAAGMCASVDAVGNVHGVLPGADTSLPEVLLGSHYDTVVDAGKCAALPVVA
jgi:allantoate deiminase